MTSKTITICIPNDKKLPDAIKEFSLEENYMMLKMGCESLIEGRKLFANLTSNEIYKKVENEFNNKIKILTDNIEMEKKTSLLMQEKIVKIYEVQIENLNNALKNAISQIEAYKIDNSISLNEEINKVKEKYELLLQEKDKQNQMNREIFDKAEKLLNRTNNKSSSSIGSNGEDIFENLADTFKDFEGFKIEDKSKQKHKGDFHLFFKDFNVLVDSKNYSSVVSKKEIDKIESDLISNSNMNYAWLVSLNTNICEYNRFPIDKKWITTDDGVQKCILMINNLLDNKDPRSMLRLAWNFTNEFNILTKKTGKEDVKIEEYIKKNSIYIKQIEKSQDTAIDLRRSINTTYNILKTLDNNLLEMLSTVSDNILNEKFGFCNKLKEWWNENIEYVDDSESIILSTELWNRFKKENKDYIVDKNITIEIFKDVITTNIVNSSNYLEKTKKGAIEFIGFRWKEKTPCEIENLQIENIIIEKEKRIKKEKTLEYYFNKEADNKILNDYADDSNDIMSMSTYDIRPWQIVSLLMRYNIIKKRDEARGYDKYKETEEYKNKLKK